MKLRILLIAGLLLGLTPCTWAQGQIEDPVIKAAIDKGVAYLQTRRDASDGAYRGEWAGEDYRSGETALTLLALLKAGAKPGSPQINQGFAWLMAQPHRRIYCVSVAVLALEARYTPENTASIKDDKPLKSQIRKRFMKKAPPAVRQWLAGAVAYLSQHQDLNGLWKYPFFGDPDISNTQFAILALKAAERMGVKVDPEIYLKIATQLVECQEKGGQQVMSFPVPAADRRIAGLHDRRDRLKKSRRRRGSAKRASHKKASGSRTRAAGQAQERATVTRTKMTARGWGYRPGDAPRGSMTAAGLAVLVVCKSVLEGRGSYDDTLGPKVDVALRDGAAWLANRFDATKNPGAENDWLFYYLYTLERAGTLLALNRFGQRNWYQEGAQSLLNAQQGDGRFHVSTGGTLDGDISATCFAILFLERSTVPVIKRVATGGGVTYNTPKAPIGSTTGGPASADVPGGRSVTFSFNDRAGRTVSVAGSFNGWSASANPLKDNGDGTYTLVLTVPKGRASYKFVVDGSSWRQDLSNPNAEPDGHGGKNSVLE
jgi:hypothetical protein